ncbi:hypothetical protein EV363DRAFT_1417642 [Boletus edulis]|nr:hypothetical protein EV363DRAFT_1417642 [Boletus edulis]
MYSNSIPVFCDQVPQLIFVGHMANEVGRPSVPLFALPILDRTIGALIEDIAKAKGDNITVIFDCCHSASGTRGQDDECVPRSVDLHFNIPETLDDYIWGSRDVSIASNFAYHGLRSHVLLAACREKASAYEHKGRGFTSALLAALGSCPAKGLTPTYAELLQWILLESEHKFKNTSSVRRIQLASRLVRCEGVSWWPDFLPCSDSERWLEEGQDVDVSFLKIFFLQA